MQHDKEKLLDDEYYYNQDEIVSEILENQLRRRAMSKYCNLPRWSLFV